MSYRQENVCQGLANCVAKASNWPIDATIVAPASFASNEIQQIPQEKPREAAIVSALKLRHIA
jgi:hypothetical protein